MDGLLQVMAGTAALLGFVAIAIAYGVDSREGFGATRDGSGTAQTTWAQRPTWLERTRQRRI